MNSLGGYINNRRFAQHFVRQLQSMRLRNNTTTTNASNNEPEIIIPLRKERSATDILNALEKTVNRDPTAAHYKFHDDPFLIPMSNLAKRTFALSKESGRKAAKWILKEHANLFDHKIAEPEIPAFMPKAVYEKKEQVSEELLMTVINQGAVTDALTIYKLLEEDTPVECKQALLELLCFYNSMDQLEEDLIEERWYRKAATRQKQPWKNSMEIDGIFEFLKKQDKPIAAAAYNALISGTAKYMKVDKAWSLFEEAESKGIPLNLTTYNYLIKLVPLMRDGWTERKALLLEMLGKINQSGLKPTVGTLNASLKVALAIQVHKLSTELARSLFTEFKNLGIEPCLASYYNLLQIFYKDRGPKSNLLRELLDELEGKEFTMQDPEDTLFFVSAMEIARYHMRDFEVAEKLHKLLLTGENYDFIGESFKEGIYYRHYTVLLLKSLPFDDFMKTYDLMVPHIYIPEPSVMGEIIKELALANVSTIQEVLPRLFSHMVMFDQLERQDLAVNAINLMRTIGKPTTDSPVNEKYAEAAWTLWTHIGEQNKARMQKISWTGKLIADVALLCLRGNEFDKFITIINFMAKEQATFTGIADIEQINEMFEACLQRGHAPAALDVLHYSVEVGFEEVLTMAKTIQSTFVLTTSQEDTLISLVGSEALKTKSTIDE